MTVKLDKGMKAILKVLFENSRTSLTEISEKTGIPFSTVRYKINTMIENNLIKKFTTIVDPDKLGIISSILLIKVNKNSDKVLEYCKNMKNSVIIARTIGEYNYIMEVVGHSISEISDVINELMAVDGVVDVRVNIVLRWEKWEFPVDAIK
ncbi:MAG: Lrp/AsnC family transcriptional regulator [Candidatus Asgardarchaeia archaeon]